MTDDASGVPQKPFRRSVDQIFAAACLLATCCIDPFSQRLATFEHIVALLAEWRRIETANRKIAVCLGMSWWKRRWIGDFLRSAAGPPRRRRIVRSALAAAATRPGSAIAVWASRLPAGLAALAAHQDTPLITVEDGFLRSVGLGSDFVPAASLALDASGSHCDPKVCSDLERLLRDTEFDDELLARARNLTARLVDQGITKYDVATPSGSLRRGAAALTAGHRRILVPGQVEDDLSVRLGGEGISSNLDFLARVRAANPDAIVLYKPHPDVEAGHRHGAVPWKLAARFADAVIDCPIATILAEIDEVHVLTSLTGFEALLRGLKVVVYGRPFYAGWGLTKDVTAIDRGRRLSLERTRRRRAHSLSALSRSGDPAPLYARAAGRADDGSAIVAGRPARDRAPLAGFSRAPMGQGRLRVHRPTEPLARHRRRRAAVSLLMPVPRATPSLPLAVASTVFRARRLRL